MSSRQSVALTGASGFVGRVLVARLLASGYRVRALSRSPGRCLQHEDVTEIIGDLATPGALAELVKGSDCLIHLAAAIAGRRQRDFERVNAVGTRKLIEAMEQTHPGCRLIHISSLAARLPQISHYARSKRQAEQIVESSHLDWLILRPPAIYGPADPALAPLWRALASGWLVQTGPARARFSLLHVDDLCDAIVHLIDRPWPLRRTACLDDGHRAGYTWSELARLAGSLRGRPTRTLRLPRFALSLMATANLGISYLTGHQPLLTPGKVRELTHPDWVCGDNVALASSGWRPKRQLASALTELPGWSTRS
ncbi:NAD-dependent epimerase/dehydratase family protein [Wenzhouxiangella limi]|uniref:NAD-dependent epimerase/dehydratase family protein n=1 Tax=Wenzhouxiangella limi TaxID=2707351 RepID=A0A845UXT9_9GAMM|nr:NAD-dependent epimerase/dehydratase family protein [Wenzhouxiangella limi]